MCGYMEKERDAFYSALCELEHVLSDLEWRGTDGDGFSACPCCGANDESRIHAKACRLNNALNLASEVKKRDYSDILDTSDIE
jgi:hypothetical protein